MFAYDCTRKLIEMINTHGGPPGEKRNKNNGKKRKEKKGEEKKRKKGEEKKKKKKKTSNKISKHLTNVNKSNDSGIGISLSLKTL